MSSPNLQLIRDALDNYAEQMKINLNDNPFAEQVKNCETPGAVLQLLEKNRDEFKEYRDKNRKFIDCLNPVVKFVHAFSGILDEAASLVPFQPAKLIFVGIDVLFTAAEGVSASYDALLELFECIGSFLKRLEIYTKISLSPLMTEIIVKIMVELLSILAQAKKQIKQGRFKQFAKKLLGDSEIENILRRLDRLTQDEARMTEAHILEVVHGLMNNMKVVMDGGEVSITAIRKTLVTMQDLVNKINKMDRDRLHEKSISWLSPPDASQNQVTARDDNHDGSAVWLTTSGNFKEWNAKGCLLWICGKPGSGKTILCSTIIEESMALRDAGLGLTAYYYFDFRNTAKQDIRGLLSSLLVQLCSKSDSCYQVLSRLYSTYDNGYRSPETKALVQCLKDMLGLPEQPTIYLIIDALDECPNTSGVASQRDRVLELIEDLVESQLPNVRICATGRPETDILDVLTPLASHTVSLHDEAGQKQDIIDYVTFVVSSDRKMRKWRAEEKKLVVDTISEKADGMFRWVVCQMEVLRHRIPGTILRALKELPRTLDETYERILLGIDKDSQEYALCLFQCLCVSIRPLHLAELAEVLAVLFDTGHDSEDRVDWRSDDAQKALLSTCSSLITVVNVNGIPVVQFAHFTVREFLTSDRLAKAEERLSRYHILPHAAHMTLARASLGVLLSLDGHVDRRAMEEHPLAIYGAQHWVDHAKFGTVSLDVRDLMERLFDRDRPYFAAWVWIYDIDRPFGEKMATMGPMEPEASPLYYAALCGFPEIVKHLGVAHPGDLNTGGGVYNTPLNAALNNVDFDVVRALLEYGVNINALDDEGASPLLMASISGNCDAVQLLLDGGASLDFPSKDGQTALSTASRFGRADVVHVLIKSGANLASRDDDHSTPLHQASKQGHLAIVQDLLDNGADQNVQDEELQTPLHLAASAGHLGIVQLLIQHGSALDEMDKDQETPLHLALHNGKIEVAQFLIKNCANIMSKDRDGQTPLHRASQHGAFELMEKLLGGGVDVNVQNSIGETSLHFASGDGKCDTVAFLVERGADVNIGDAGLASPLHDASTSGHLEVVELLVEHGANVNELTSSQETPLHRASGCGKLEVAHFLIERGSNVDSKDSEGRTPLHTAAQGGHLDVVELLLELGADINVQDSNDKLPFDLASRSGEVKVARFLAERMGLAPPDAVVQGDPDTDQLLLEDRFVGDEDTLNSGEEITLHDASARGQLNVVQSLLDRGIDVDSRRDEDRMTSLHVACEAGKLEVARLLIDRGADVNCHEEEGGTPLHKASEFGHVDLARLLLDRGARVDTRTQHRVTPLHIASGAGHFEVTQLLIERGANVNAVAVYGFTPLLIAMSEDSEDQDRVRKLLIEHGAT